MKNAEFVLEVMDFFSDDMRPDELEWLVEDGEIKFYIRCNDYFFWGCADAEELEPGDITALRLAVEDCKAACSGDEIHKRVYGSSHGRDLFLCRKRKERPQGCCYPKERELWPLFDAAGPEREPGMGNPYRPGEREELIAKREQESK